MPNPHFRVETYSRAGGRSVVAAAAYRSGEVLTASPSVVSLAAYRSGEYLGDTARGEIFDYTRKEGVEWTAIFAPADAPAWASDRQALWNEVELSESRKNARLARGIEASLPREVSSEQWPGMVKELAQHFTRHGLVVDAAIHNVKARDGGQNPHVHLLITDRPVTASGFASTKTNVRFLNSRLALQNWRASWEKITNDALAAAGRSERLSLQSYVARGVDQTPTKPLGPKASALEKRGIATPRGEENRRIMQENALRALMRQQQNEGRAPLWSDFGANVGAGVNAARDAVHRFRQREASDMADGNVERQFNRQAETGSRSGLFRQRDTAPGAAPSDASARLVNLVKSNDVAAAAKAVGATLHRAGVTERNAPHPPALPKDQTAERYKGRTLAGNDSPRGPGAPPRASFAASQTANRQQEKGDTGRRLNNQAMQEVSRAGAVLRRENVAQSSERNVSDRSPFGKYTKQADKGIEKQQQQQRSKDRER